MMVVPQVARVEERALARVVCAAESVEAAVAMVEEATIPLAALVVMAVGIWEEGREKVMAVAKVVDAEEVCSEVVEMARVPMVEYLEAARAAAMVEGETEGGMVVEATVLQWTLQQHPAP
jgi:ABC-type uncharacterized transport system permease subunit